MLNKDRVQELAQIITDKYHCRVSTRIDIEYGVVIFSVFDEANIAQVAIVMPLTRLNDRVQDYLETTIKYLLAKGV